VSWGKTWLGTWPRPWSLRRRLVLTTAGVLCLGMAWLTWWQSEQLRPRWWQALEASLVDTASVLAAQVAAASPGSEPDIRVLSAAWTAAHAQPLSADISGTLKERIALEVSLTDRHGIVLYDSAQPATVGRDNSQWNDVLRTLHGAYGARASRSDPHDPHSIWLHVAAPVRHGDELIGVLTVAAPDNAFAAVASAARLQLAASALIATAMMAGLALLITAWITQPLARLTAHVRRAAAGAREPLPELGKGDIAALGDALQDLRHELDGRSYVVDYVQTLTHELKSPPAERTRFLANLLSESARLHDLVDRLLAQAALERRETLAEVSAIDLVELIHEILGNLAAQAAQQRVSFALSGIGQVQGERFLVRQALENVLRNAIEFSPSGNEVQITIAAKRVCVRDHGPGIPDFALARLGERFFSLPRPGNGRKGSGLGLAFAILVTHLHGGECQVTNHPEGGAEARLRFG
jgi:two-component system sensor histidine kinase CreC